MTSHLSVVPAPVLRRYLPTEPPPEATPTPRPVTPSDKGQPPSPAAARPLRRLRRRPGPRPTTLRYEPELTTRDVAELVHVTPATVRRWVARGHLTPIRQEGRANVFDSEDVQVAFDKISARRRATGQASQESWPVPKPAERIPPKHHDALVTITEAGQLLQISASTIRSWIHRGHLKPVASAAPGPVLIRVGDVVTAARSRRIPQPKPAWRPRR